MNHKQSSKFLAFSIIFMISMGVFSSVFTVKSVVALPGWAKVNSKVRYVYEAYDESLATPTTGEALWIIVATYEDPFDPWMDVRYQIMGQDIGTFPVYAAEGEWTTYLPPGAFGGAITTTLNFPGIGDVECYVLPQSFYDSHGNVWGGEAYYCVSTGVMVALNLVSGAYYERYRLKDRLPLDLIVATVPESNKISQLESKLAQQDSTITSLQSTISTLQNKVDGLGTVFGISIETFLMLLLVISFLALILGLVGISMARKKPLPPPPL
jgi:hypothetical protein